MLNYFDKMTIEIDIKKAGALNTQYNIITPYVIILKKYYCMWVYIYIESEREMYNNRKKQINMYN